MFLGEVTGMKQNKIYVIGITGGIAMGKSTVSSILKEVGIKIIDADEISREIVEPFHEGWYEIVNHFGNEFVNPDTTLNRKKFGEYVFGNEEKLKLLNSILHPIIIEKITKKIEELTSKGVKIAIVDAPLLFETNLDEKCDEVWVLTCGIDEQLRRIMDRDKLDYKQALARINNQMPDDLRRSKSNRVIDTSAELEDTIRYIKILLEEINDEL